MRALLVYSPVDLTERDIAYTPIWLATSKEVLGLSDCLVEKPRHRTNYLGPFGTSENSLISLVLACSIQTLLIFNAKIASIIPILVCSDLENEKELGFSLTRISQPALPFPCPSPNLPNPNPLWEGEILFVQLQMCAIVYAIRNLLILFLPPQISPHAAIVIAVSQGLLDRHGT